MYSKVWEHWRWEYTLCFHIGYGNKSMVMSSLWSGHFHPTSGTILTFKHFLRYIRTPSLFSWGVSGIQEYIYIFFSVLSVEENNVLATQKVWEHKKSPLVWKFPSIPCLADVLHQHKKILQHSTAGPQSEHDYRFNNTTATTTTSKSHSIPAIMEHCLHLYYAVR